jgi:hypothetical protein
MKISFEDLGFLILNFKRSKFVGFDDAEKTPMLTSHRRILFKFEVVKTI